MSGTAWEIVHSVDVNVSPAFAWNYMTDVANWNDPPATFELGGPFTAGSCGTTRMPGQEPRRWQLREVNPMDGYTIETALGSATLLFKWRFEGLASGGTRLTQRILLEGEDAPASGQARSAFSSNIAAGMKRIAAAMEKHQEA